MAKLSDEEASLLKRLTDKQKAPDDDGIRKSLDIRIDLGDETQVKNAHKLGLLRGLFEDDPPEGDEPPEGDDPPKRTGYFG